MEECGNRPMNRCGCDPVISPLDGAGTVGMSVRGLDFSIAPITLGSPAWLVDQLLKLDTLYTGSNGLTERERAGRADPLLISWTSNESR